MTDEVEITRKFWKALQSDRTFMLGLSGSSDTDSQPMTAQIEAEGNQNVIWIFSAKDVQLVRAMGETHRAVGQFVSKGHDLFASIQGSLARVEDRSKVDLLWNRFVAAWYPGGKEDPNLQLLRFDPTHAHIWLNDNSLMAGVKILLGADPKKEYQGKTADVSLAAE